MRIEESVHGGIGVLSIIGDLVLDEATELKKLMMPYLEENKFTGLIWNLGSVSYIDSSGVGLIVSFFKSLQRLNKKFVLAGLNPNNREIINISKLDKFLMIAKNSESALKILNN